MAQDHYITDNYAPIPSVFPLQICTIINMIGSYIHNYDDFHKTAIQMPSKLISRNVSFAVFNIEDAGPGMLQRWLCHTYCSDCVPCTYSHHLPSALPSWMSKVVIFLFKRRDLPVL